MFHLKSSSFPHHHRQHTIAIIIKFLFSVLFFHFKHLNCIYSKQSILSSPLSQQHLATNHNLQTFHKRSFYSTFLIESSLPISRLASLPLNLSISILPLQF